MINSSDAAAHHRNDPAQSKGLPGPGQYATADASGRVWRHTVMAFPEDVLEVKIR